MEGAKKGKKVVEQIRKVADSHVDIDYLIADLMLMKEVSRVADEVSKKYPRIDVLLNNVGAYFTSREVTEEGFERTFALNHLGYFLMTKKLLPLVEKSNYKRIVNVSSSAHYGIDFEFDNINGEKKYAGFETYKKSKLANVMFTYELAKKDRRYWNYCKLLASRVCIYKFWKNNNFFWRNAIRLAMMLTAINVKDGAKTSIHLACSDEVKNITGKILR